MKIGIFGGTFDPIHLGHLILAEQCREQAKLDQVWFIPCNIQPLKDRTTSTTDRQRCEMVDLAIAGHSDFRLSKIELDRDGISYMVDTLEQIHNMQSGDELFLIIGGDSLKNFSQWKSPDRICQLSIPLVVNRPGYEGLGLDAFQPFVDLDRMSQILQYQVVSPLIDISSTQLRANVLKSRSIRYQVPRAVEKYIQTHQLYQAATSESA